MSEKLFLWELLVRVCYELTTSLSFSGIDTHDFWSSCIVKKVQENVRTFFFDDFGLNEAWCGDITYIPTNEGWLYLASVIDLGTRRLVGYSFEARMDKRLVKDDLSKAFRHERPRAGCLFVGRGSRMPQNDIN